MLCFEQKTLEARIMAFIFDSSSSDEWLTKKKKTVHLRDMMPCQEAKNTGQSGILLDPWIYYLKPGDNENTDWNENFIVKAQKSENEVELKKKRFKNWTGKATRGVPAALNWTVTHLHNIRVGSALMGFVVLCVF